MDRPVTPPARPLSAPPSTYSAAHTGASSSSPSGLRKVSFAPQVASPLHQPRVSNAGAHTGAAQTSLNARKIGSSNLQSVDTLINPHQSLEDRKIAAANLMKTIKSTLKDCSSSNVHVAKQANLKLQAIVNQLVSALPECDVFAQSILYPLLDHLANQNIDALKGLELNSVSINAPNNVAQTFMLDLYLAHSGEYDPASPDVTVAALIAKFKSYPLEDRKAILEALPVLLDHLDHFSSAAVALTLLDHPEVSQEDPAPGVLSVTAANVAYNAVKTSKTANGAFNAGLEGLRAFFTNTQNASALKTMIYLLARDLHLKKLPDSVGHMLLTHPKASEIIKYPTGQKLYTALQAHFEDIAQDPDESEPARLIATETLAHYHQIIS